MKLLTAVAFVILLVGSIVHTDAQDSPGVMGSLARPQEGRSMRATSTFRQGNDGKYDPNAPPKHDLEERSNSDNFRVAPGLTHVLLDAKGPGVITHIWMTFLGPEIQD